MYAASRELIERSRDALDALISAPRRIAMLYQNNRRQVKIMEFVKLLLKANRILNDFELFF